MLRYLLISLALAQTEAVPSASELKWSVVPDTVHVGGCATLVLELPIPNASGVELQIDDGKVRRLSNVSEPLERGNTAVALLWVLFNEVALGREPSTPGEPESPPWRPLFDRPGARKLTVLYRGRSMGSKVVTVVPAPPEADAALACLYPTTTDQKDITPEAYPWLAVLTGLFRPVDCAVLPHARSQLAALQKHPEWAELAPVVLEFQEAYVVVDEVAKTRARNGGQTPPGQRVPELSAQTLEMARRPLNGPYAKEIQTQLNGRIRMRNWAATQSSKE